ncbi:nucleotide sugar dehydrogenase [Paenibacillus thermotolerans]|uniref:nucleotide sugar dehydrogenase n=1 Tax=Paenibacillus thermotolerans TaxID=3027807 RepID=UPI002367A962|nr:MULTISPECIES: nucleotide sugar dehydrogenase [unclassified Paenibacillus]
MNNDLQVAVIGLGYVGLPLAVHMAKKGFKVIGFDKDLIKIKKLNSGRSYIPDVASDEIYELINRSKLQVLLPCSAIKKAEYVVVAVPTPLHRNEPNLGAVKSAAKFIARNLQRGQTIVFESSTYPGTLEEEIVPILAESGLKEGEDYYVGYSPERIDSGSRFEMEQIPKVVSGLTERCREKIERLYGKLFTQTVPVSTPRVAEMCKLFENIQRLVNISLVNEMEMLCTGLNIDFRECLDAAATKPFGFTVYWPGPGIGGHCIPVDPLYFQWKAKRHGMKSSLIEAASRINRQMPYEIVDRIVASMPDGADEAEQTILIIGVAYKKDVNDTRESSAVEIIRLLGKRPYRIYYHDPFVPDLKVSGKKYVSNSLTPDLIKKANAVVILTDHSGIDWSIVKKHARNIVDTRGVIRTVQTVKTGGTNE